MWIFAGSAIAVRVMSAAGIHSAAVNSPDETLMLLDESVAPELQRADMYFSVFYGMVDPTRGKLDYASAGHPYAFKIAGDGGAHRLEATAPPMGLTPNAPISRKSVEWAAGEDLLALWTDGMVESRSPAGEMFGEARLLELLVEHREASVEEIVARVFAAQHEFSPKPSDDRTLVVLRI